jgi:hypothetical protein
MMFMPRCPMFRVPGFGGSAVMIVRGLAGQGTG